MPDAVWVVPLLALVAILFVVYKLRPETFKLSARFARWFSLDLEMRGSRPVRLGEGDADDERDSDPNVNG